MHGYAHNIRFSHNLKIMCIYMKNNARDTNYFTKIFYKLLMWQRNKYIPFTLGNSAFPPSKKVPKSFLSPLVTRGAIARLKGPSSLSICNTEKLQSVQYVTKSCVVLDFNQLVDDIIIKVFDIQPEEALQLVYSDLN